MGFWKKLFGKEKTVTPQPAPREPEPDPRCLEGWELAKQGASQGKSGFHHDWNPVSFLPFSVCGWAPYRDPRWGNAEGVAFRVNRDCFGRRKPLLYYLDDDNWPGPEGDTELSLIRQYSSGISALRVERRRCADWGGKIKENVVVLFELDPAAIKPTVQLNGSKVPTAEVGEYVFVLPRAGEFYCLLGEVLDGEMIPLHRDDFCMK